LTALSIGTAALISKAAQAQILPLSPEYRNELLNLYRQREDVWSFPADIAIGHYQTFYGTPYPQSQFNNLIAELGPPPLSLLQFYNASPAQAGAPLGIPAGYYTTYFPGFSPPAIPDQFPGGGAPQLSPEYHNELLNLLQRREEVWSFPASVDIGHYQTFYGTPYPQSQFNSLIAEFGPPPLIVLQAINSSPAQAGAPLGIPAGDYTTYFPGFWPSGSQGASGSCFLRGTQIATPSGDLRSATWSSLRAASRTKSSGLVAVCARRQKQICPCVLPEDHWRPTCRMLICGCRRSTRCLSMGC
jgi:hypothetical protein